MLLDLDGVVYVGGQLLPGAVEALCRLRRMGKTLRFLTNDPRPTREELVHKLLGMGVEVHAGEMITSGAATAELLRQRGTRSAYVVGSPGLVSEVRGVGIEVLEGGVPEAVVVGGDASVNYLQLQRATRLICQGSRFVATNPDGSFPTPEGPSPAAGAFAAFVAAAAGREPDETAGKPHPAMFEAALEGLDATPEKVAMVGDNPQTDIRGARQMGLAGILISEETTGPSTDTTDTDIPDAVVPDLLTLFDPAVGD